MGYIVFARKYRPQNFDEVVGQEHVTRTLKNALKEGKIGHAYLFSGPRGVGKTSVARILAKALNCEKGITTEPCNACERCIEITEGRSIDVLEIDGASNRRIEEVRNLREGIGYAPAKSRYKVYIIDEVHMLTNEAFNALLKTLEEPPPHVVFIFATTEPHKVPQTILSRCQRFDFRKLTTSEILNRLIEIKEKEGIKIADPALSLIARRADGALRDAEVMLEQLAAYTQGEIDVQDIKEVFGFIDRTFYQELIKSVIEEDDKKIINQIENIFEQGFDIKEFTTGLIDFIRELLLVKLDVRNPFGPEEDPELKKIAGETDEDTLVGMLNLSVELERSLRFIPYSKALIELYLLKMARIPYIKDIDQLIEDAQKSPEKTETSLLDKKPLAKEEPLTGKELWERLKLAITDQGTPLLKTFINAVNYDNYDEEKNRLILSNPRRYNYTDQQIFDLQAAAKRYLDINIKISIKQPPKEEKPSSEKKREDLLNHPLVKKAAKLFKLEDIY